MSLTRRRTLIAAAAATAALVAQPAFAALGASDQAIVDRATAYLEGLTEAKARFVQTDAQGRSIAGTVYLKRPGKARFEYDAPSKLLVVSNGSTVNMTDGRLNNFSSYPLGATPLSLFLAKNIRFDRGVQVTRVARMADGFTITAQDVRKETAGQIELTFAESPLRLVGWTVVDAQRRTTRVKLDNLQRASGLSGDLFVLKDPRPKNVGRGKM